MPLIYANMVGGQDELVFDGASFVLNREGEVTHQLPLFKEALGIVTIEHGDPAAGRDCAGAAHRGRVSTRRCASACAITSARTAFPACCSGLSGGIDSALTLAVAVDALGADKVRAVMMPSQYTASISREDARAEAEALGVRYTEIADQAGIRRIPGGAGGGIQGTAAGHDRGKSAGAHPRHAADGVVEQDRRDRADHRQQERDGRPATPRSTATWRAASPC